MKIIGQLFLSCLVLIGFSHAAHSEIKLSNALARDIGKAYGFYLGQNYSLSQISKKYPALAGQALLAEKEFDAAFKSSVEGMEDLMQKNVKDEWSKLKKEIQTQIAGSVNINNTSQADAIAFVEQVRERARGNIESPIIETLLIFKSGYEKNPEKEFLDGYKYKYSTDGAGKAKGVAFSVESPITWAAEEGNRPNIVQKFTSGNGRGFEFFMVMVKEIPLEPGSQVTESDVAEILNPTDIKAFIPDGGVYLGSGKLTLEQLPGFWLRYKVNSKRMKDELGLDAIMYTVYYKNKAIQMQGMIFTSVNGQQINRGGEFQKYEKLFDLMANSLVITSKYK
jgi:hypothetical protein